MAAAVLMPKAGITVETCIIGSWRKNVGDRVTAGEILFDYETDKAAFECASTAEGTLLEIFYDNGDEVAVLTPVCAIGEPGEEVSRLSRQAEPAAGQTTGQAAGQPIGQTVGNAAGRTAGQADATAAAASGLSAAAGSRISAANATGPGLSEAAESGLASPAADSEAKPAIAISSHGLKISPRARVLAKRLGLSYENAAPTGPHGRIIERDVERLLNSGAAERELDRDSLPPQAPNAPNALTPDGRQPGGIPQTGGEIKAPGFTDVKLPMIRRTIADTMMKSLSGMAQITHHHSFDASDILALRADFKKRGERYGLGAVTIGDIVLFAVSRIVKQHPNFNAHLLDGYMLRKFQGVNLGVAVDTERGLIVPTLFDADKKSLTQISAEVKELAKAAANGSISPDTLRGATITVSNLGTTGVEMFTPIINPPQVAIIGVCGIKTAVKEKPDGGIGAYPSMGLSITYDHRAVDGAPASRFAKAICEGLEQIYLLLSAENAGGGI